MQFFVDLHTGIDSQRGELCQQEVGNRRIQACTKHLLTQLISGLFDLLFLTQIFRIQARSVLALIIAQRHSIPTPPTDDQSLEQGGSFPPRTVAAIFSAGGTILLPLAPVGLILPPRDLPNLSVAQEIPACSPGYTTPYTLTLNPFS